MPGEGELIKKMSVHRVKKHVFFLCWDPVTLNHELYNGNYLNWLASITPIGAVRCISCPCQSPQFTMLSMDSHPALLELGNWWSRFMLLSIQRAKVKRARFSHYLQAICSRKYNFKKYVLALKKHFHWMY